MALKPINLTQSINPTNDNRANTAIIPGDNAQNGELSGMFTQNTGTCQSGGIQPLYKKSISSDSSIKTIDDINNFIHSPKLYTITITDLSNGGQPVSTSDAAYGESIYVHTNSYPGSPGIYYLSGTWQQVVGSDDYGSTIAYGNGVFVSINQINGDVATSPDGINWTFAVANITAYAKVSFWKDYFICFVGNKIYYSSDGASWSYADMGRAYIDVVHDGNQYVFINSSGYIATSTDLVTFTQTLHSELSGALAISYGNGFYLIMTVNNSIISYNLISFTSYILPFYCAAANKILGYNNGVFYTAAGVYAVGTWYSNDGIIWTVTGYNQATSITSSGSKFLILQQSLLVVTAQTEIKNNNPISLYSNDVLLANNIINMGLSENIFTKYYDDIIFGNTLIYGVKQQNGIVYIDQLKNDFSKDIQDEYIAVSVGQSIRFIRHLTGTDNTYLFYYDGAKTVFSPKISGTRSYSTTSITDIFDNVYLLNTGATPYYLACQERISNANGGAIGKVVSYSHNTGTGAITAIDTKNGWFYSYNNAGTVGIVGIELIAGTYYWKNYTVNNSGVFTSVDSTTFSTSVVKGINGQYSEYEVFNTKKITALGDYKDYSGGSGTGVDGINLIGYFSVINRLILDDATNYVYLRAVYNRALKSCDSLSFSIGSRYIGRTIEYSNVDFTYRPQFVLFGSKWQLIYKDFSGQFICLVFDYIQNCDVQFTKIGKNLLLLNTIDEYNVIDCVNKTMLASGLDYNGAVLYSTTKYTVRIADDVYITPYNSDVGGNAVQGIVPYAANFITAPYDQKLVFNTLTKNFYVTTGNEVAINRFNSEAYIREDLYSPIAIYAKIQNGFIFWDGEVYAQVESLIMNLDLVEQISTILFDDADFFSLFGNNYLHDGQNIYLLDVQNNTATIVARSDGMVFISYSPLTAFFFSYADNSLWTFDGGRALVKYVQLNKIFSFDSDDVISGGFNNEQNVLILSKGSVVFLVYDGRMSSFTLTTGSAFVRDKGVYYITSTEIESIMPFNIDGLGTAIRLIWQSAFFKAPGYISSAKEILFYIYSSTKSSGNVTINYYAYDEQNTFVQDSYPIAITASMYDADGYFLIRYQTIYNRVYGFSVGFDTTMDINIVNSNADISIESPAAASIVNSI